MASTYTGGHGPEVVGRHSIRRASTCCAYFLPHLKPNHRVLDLGCGPGSITADIAALVPEGSVIGLDYGESVVEIANAKAKELSLSNCSFQVGDVMSLPFEDDSFDVVHTHQVLIHLPDPVGALKEMRRVCKKGGFVACREADMDDVVLSPDSDVLKIPIEVKKSMIREKGSEAAAGKFLGKWAREAGFEEGKVTESHSYLMQPSFKDEAMQQRVADYALKTGIAKSREEVDKSIKGWEEWEKTEGSWWKTGFMSNYSRLSDLAASIQRSTATIDAYLKEHNLPEPSFDEDGPVDFRLKSEEAQKALETAKASSLELFDLLQGPAVALRPVYDGVSLQAIYRYDIASKVPIHGEISYEDLSVKCGLSVVNLRRILRFAMAWNRCFTEPRKGFVAHSAASRVLVDNPMARSGLGFMFEECWQAFAHTLDAVKQHGENEDVTKTGWSHYHKTDKSLFEYYADHPEMGRRMAEAMICFSSAVSESSQASYLVKNYPWNSLANGSGVVVDVGGAQGHISIELAQTYPNLNIILQDLPKVLEGVKEKLPSNLNDRIEIMPHDFFTEQPIQADAYLFSQIFHDWPEAECIKILRTLIPKLRPGAKVVCYDHLLPEPGTAPILRERAARDMDMIMFSLFNSRERDADDWDHLFRSADARFGQVKAWVPEGSRLGIVEAVWEGDIEGA
ncbi:O-methyltransferase protein [Rutstroemia sp. NJR-2017a BBW]|nr:O-methyltransferase protein [Rutstroemia sp. NJR-2017a BBW]